MKFGVDYAIEQRAVELRRKHDLHGRVYALLSSSGYYFRVDGVQNVGDWIGPGSVFRFERAVVLGCAAGFLADLDADVVVFEPGFAAQRLFGPDFDSSTLAQLRDAG